MGEKVTRRKRLLAIRLAAQKGLFVRSSLTDGLRAVKLFEEINGMSPDPDDFHHRMVITNTGYHFALQRRLRALGTKESGSNG